MENIVIRKYTLEDIADVIEFERNLRKQEPDTYFWDLDEKYINDVKKSFVDLRFKDNISLLAYKNGKVIGRIDSSLICSHMDGYLNAYLEWICVLKNERHSGVAQKLIQELRRELKAIGVNQLIAVVAHNDEAMRFYSFVEDAKIQDSGIFIKI